MRNLVWQNVVTYLQYILHRLVVGDSPSTFVLRLYEC